MSLLSSFFFLTSSFFLLCFFLLVPCFLALFCFSFYFPFSFVPFDGILGLALPPMSEGAKFNILGSMAAQHVLQKNMIAVYFGDHSGEDSEITFGEYRADRMMSGIFWSNVTVPGYWQVEMTDIAIGNKMQKLCKPHCEVAVDTGTSLLAGPTDIINELTDRLNVSSDCSNYAKLPTLGFVVNGHIMNLNPDDYVDKDDTGCSLGLMSLDVPPPKGPLFIFGDPFLRKYYTVFDNDNSRVGFALARHAHSTKEMLVTVSETHHSVTGRATAFKQG